MVLHAETLCLSCRVFELCSASAPFAQPDLFRALRELLQRQLNSILEKCILMLSNDGQVEPIRYAEMYTFSDLEKPCSSTCSVSELASV